MGTKEVVLRVGPLIYVLRVYYDFQRWAPLPFYYELMIFRVVPLISLV